ncbi:MAG: circadian clock KaiB family protein [Rhodopila sp.]
MSGADPDRYRLRLIVAGGTHRSRKAINTLRSICNSRLAGAVDLEVIDIYQQPEMASEYQVIAAPTLLKLLPLPVRRIIGDLSDSEQLLRVLELLPVPNS